MNAAVRKALDNLLERSPGRLLKKETVINAARSRSSPLHDEFTWNKIAGWRLNLLAEAQQLIRSYITTITTVNAGPVKTRAFVSLTPDRLKGGGSRSVRDVISSEALTQQWLADALAELAAFEARYRRIKQLAPVFEAIERVRATVKPRKKAA